MNNRVIELDTDGPFGFENEYSVKYRLDTTKNNLLRFYYLYLDK